MAHYQIVGRGLALLFAAVLTACASSTQVEVPSTQEFPSPLVVKTDVHMGIYIPKEFETYVYEDFEKVAKKKSKRKAAKKSQSSKSTGDSSKSGSEGPKTDEEESASVAEASKKEADEELPPTEQEPDEMRLKFRISLGEAQSKMIRSVFPGVFEKATLLESMEISSMPEDIDLFMVPSISKVQYTTPKTTRLNVYEIWLQYVFSIYDRNGDVVTRWRVPSYGKTPTAMMKSKESALQTATQMALRDCGAAFSTGFRQQPAVARWLQGREQRRQRQSTEAGVANEPVATESVKEIGAPEEQAQ